MPGEPGQDLVDFLALQGVQAAGGFVDDEQGRGVEKGLGQGNTLAIALGQMADQAMGDRLQTKPFQSFGHRALSLGSGQAA